MLIFLVVVAKLKGVNMTSKELNLIKKDLEVLECFRKIPRRDLKVFIENEITFEKNYNTWLISCNGDLAEEEPTKYLIKIKEWLENGL